MLEDRGKMTQGLDKRRKICINHIAKSYGDKQVFTDFSAEIPMGQCTVLMGPSGCGKTTLLRILMGLTPADVGSVSGMPERYSTVFQEDRLCMDRTAIENVAMVLDTETIAQTDSQNGVVNEQREQTAEKHLSRKQQIINITTAHLVAVGLQADDMAHPVSAYSGGMRRRVAIVRAVLAAGEMLLLDEPFQGLDEATKHQVSSYLKDHQRGRTILMVTHDPQEATLLGDHMIKMI